MSSRRTTRFWFLLPCRASIPAGPARHPQRRPADRRRAYPAARAAHRRHSPDRAAARTLRAAGPPARRRLRAAGQRRFRRLPDRQAAQGRRPKGGRMSPQDMNSTNENHRCAFAVRRHDRRAGAQHGPVSRDRAAAHGRPAVVRCRRPAGRARAAPGRARAAEGSGERPARAGRSLSHSARSPTSCAMSRRRRAAIT